MSLTLAVFVSLGVSSLALYPQIHLWIRKGDQSAGAYAHVQVDEKAYSAYVNALINGRPRRNDPYTGHDGSSEYALPENLFSIQFIPAYAIALPARFFGVTASTAFIVLAVLASLASSMAIFWLLLKILGDNGLAATGVLIVLCFGTLAAAEGEINVILRSETFSYNFFPFIRRYQPAASFPVFFLFCASVWSALKSDKSASIWAWSVVAGILFTLLVFSYFYLWTAALAWLACILVFHLIGQVTDQRQLLTVLSIIGVFALGALTPYFLMLMHRAESMDVAQALALSHTPDLFRSTELIGAVVLVTIAYFSWRRVVKWRDHTLLFCASLAFMPFLVFNQQIITGLVLQPIHYQLFIANYTSLLSLFLCIVYVWRNFRPTAISHRLLAFLSMLAFAWGTLEAVGSTHRGDHLADLRIKTLPALERLTGMINNDRRVGMKNHGERPIVFAHDTVMSDELSTVLPFAGVLWARHLYVFGSLTREKSKERFYQQIYYSGVSAENLSQHVMNGNMAVLTELMGVERVVTALSPHPQTITFDEVESEIQKYAHYAAHFSGKNAADPTLSFVIVPAELSAELTHIDQWYERDEGEESGSFVIYRVKLRTSK